MRSVGIGSAVRPSLFVHLKRNRKSKIKHETNKTFDIGLKTNILCHRFIRKGKRELTKTLITPLSFSVIGF